MSSRVLPAVLAVSLGVFLAVLLLVPFVFRSYRKRGEVGLGPGILAFAFLVYGLALVAYTLFPVPQLDDAWCARHPTFTHPQLNPLRFLSDIAKDRVAPGWRGVLTNPAVQQVVFNIALFVPLGAYLRHRRINPFRVVAAGFAVSLLIECTQLTGNWFLYPCPYRLFDVDDLLANTLGTAVGLMFAPLLRRMYGRTDLPAEAPRPVTTGRRWLGMLVDLVSVTLLGGVFSVASLLIAGTDNRILNPWLPAVLLLAVPALGANGATLGQRAVRLKRVRADGGRAGLLVLPALAGGTFGYFALTGLGGDASSWSGLMLLACGILAWRPRSHRGLSGLVSGLYVVDARGSVSEELSTPVRPGARPG
ncbi:VanZ family protein [Actinophytocola algeriensis]|uniref:Glycopeptide antibiotics resistance protein n=1 Tax=Actinophytocola algeriensis TaxID=1768010 RepID=A0A7W7VCT6_9PSEU|nr:VanZ family protein [Actinophytocola algeriensis]MBB4905461.1 glycopeptide antibiotics resistance protein [Actinophytocola algeriensis]MBE1472854.1 glycopeptide antibiotics resistance protein [Actinophytocola algeriensis]